MKTKTLILIISLLTAITGLAETSAWDMLSSTEGSRWESLDTRNFPFVFKINDANKGGNNVEAAFMGSNLSSMKGNLTGNGDNAELDISGNTPTGGGIKLSGTLSRNNDISVNFVGTATVTQPYGGENTVPVNIIFKNQALYEFNVQRNGFGLDFWNWIKVVNDYFDIKFESFDFAGEVPTYHVVLPTKQYPDEFVFDGAGLTATYGDKKITMRLKPLVFFLREGGHEGVKSFSSKEKGYTVVLFMNRRTDGEDGIGMFDGYIYDEEGDRVYNIPVRDAYKIFSSGDLMPKEYGVSVPKEIKWFF